MERIAHPGIPDAIGRQADVILQPDALILEDIGLPQPPGQVPGQGVDLAAFFDVFNDDCQVCLRAQDGLHRLVNPGQFFDEFIIIRDVAQVVGIV